MSIMTKTSLTYGCPHSTIELYSGDEAAVKGGTATLLAKREGQGDRDRNTAFDGGHATIIVDPWPAVSRRSQQLPIQTTATSTTAR